MSETFGPLDNNRSVGIIENLFESQAIEGAVFNPIQINVINLDSARSIDSPR